MLKNWGQRSQAMAMAMIGQGMALSFGFKDNTAREGHFGRDQVKRPRCNGRGSLQVDVAGWGLRPGTFWGGERSIGQWQDSKGVATCTAMAAGDRSTLGLDIAARAANN